jgi:hypothetical protein
MTEPVLTKRADALGWLASTPADYPFRFATAGDTEREATTNFEQAVQRWERLAD